ncbi:probable G-protein coupled receptor 160 [Lates calcarifer]|uniref:Probable G-protein coupled receptor 160 n=1 Tax=Lates calcarifer TaxID=8187 RepID=A0AAJ8B629_LATCA|nr:probable G-protein coupled receptor 160 [Lates calcarifer]XP_050927110.1 probable G-protein coupled receptor 160 [Lates calcarifer]
MLAIVEQWVESSGCHTDNTEKYLFLMVFKLGLDAAIFYLCCWKLRTSFLNMCSLSIILADLVMVSCTAAVWFLGGERSPVSSCFILAHSSAIFGALPLPMICLGLFDYCIEDTCIGNKSALCKFLRNVVLTLLVWTQAVIYSFVSVKAEVTVLDYARGIKAAVCVVEESSLIIYFILGLFTTVIFAMLPFWSRIPQWVREADRLSELREERENQRSDLFTSCPPTETKNSKERYPEETIESRPPLWFSLTLGFTIFWMPYLAVSVACLVFGYGVPAYITVNLLWLECTNSLLVGVVFWIKGRSLGPYSHLPENVCLWRIYWYLSKGTQQQQLPVAVFNPSKDKRNTLLYV